MLNSIKPFDSKIMKKLNANKCNHEQVAQQHSQPAHDCVKFSSNETKEDLNKRRIQLWKKSIKESGQLYNKKCEKITENNLSFPKLIKQYSKSLKRNIDQSNNELNKQYEQDKKASIAKFDADDNEIQNKLDALEQNKSKN